ncbi:hypothetical protein D3C80_2136540 [compost metagenome]
MAVQALGVQVGGEGHQVDHRGEQHQLQAQEDAQEVAVGQDREEAEGEDSGC